ncbi:MAG: hypothetical protein ACRD3O_24330, partial [Terriglobia bacterium]
PLVAAVLLVRPKHHDKRDVEPPRADAPRRRMNGFAEYRRLVLDQPSITVVPKGRPPLYDVPPVPARIVHTPAATQRSPALHQIEVVV